MNAVWNEMAAAWVHEGMSGFTSSGIALEMKSTNYYHHQPIAPRPNIVDVGGHVGIFSREMAKRYPSGQIFCIEPHPDNAELARRNLADFPNAVVIESAVSYRGANLLHPFQSGSNSGGSQLPPAGVATFENATKFAEPITVDTLKLEDLNLTSIDLLKLDCEGSEYEILAYCRLSTIREIVGEWHSVPGIPQFDRFCTETLPDWKLQTWGSLTGPLGLFRLASIVARNETESVASLAAET